MHSGLEIRSHDRGTSGREAAVAAAEREVVGLITVSAQTSVADVERLKEGATSGFRDELEQQSQALRDALKQQKVTSTGEIASSAVSSYSKERATVLVAAKGNVSNTADQEPQPRSYRLEVQLQLVEGRWLVSDLEFV